MKVLALIGTLSIVYILVNIGYSWNFESQFIRTISIQENLDSPVKSSRSDGNSMIPEFIDEKKYQRPTVTKDRYVHDFNYNGTVWPMPQDTFLDEPRYHLCMKTLYIT